MSPVSSLVAMVCSATTPISTNLEAPWMYSIFSLLFREERAKGKLKRTHFLIAHVQQLQDSGWLHFLSTGQALLCGLQRLLGIHRWSDLYVKKDLSCIVVAPSHVSVLHPLSSNYGTAARKIPWHCDWTLVLHCLTLGCYNVRLIHHQHILRWARTRHWPKIEKWF